MKNLRKIEKGALTEDAFTPICENGAKWHTFDLFQKFRFEYVHMGLHSFSSYQKLTTISKENFDFNPENLAILDILHFKMGK